MDKRRQLFLIFAFLSMLAACNSSAVTLAPTSVPAPTPAPLPATVVPAAPTNTTAATGTTVPTAVPASPTAAPATTARIAVQLQDNSIRFLDPSGSETLAYSATDPVDLSSVFTPGNVLGSSLFLPLSARQATVVRVEPGGAQTLNWIKGPVYGIAAGTSGLAWGAADIGDTQSTVRIMFSAGDGSGLKTGFQETYTGVPRVMRVMRWSRDGSKIYFGKEPIGIGGYILFSGLTNLWSLDPGSGKATELIPQAAPNAAVCIDDLSPDEKLAADHCPLKNMEVIDMASRTAKVVNAPPTVPQFGLVGGARFSPDSARLAYGLARNDPNNEQGWVAVADVAIGTSTLIGTSPAQDYFSVSAWLDSKTLVLQSQGQTPGIWTLGADGSNLKRLGNGTFLGIVPGGQAQQGACGDIRMLGPNPPRDKSARLAEDCFFHAFQQCRAATLTVTISGVDAGTIHQFTLEKTGNQCRIVDSVVRYVLPRPTQVPQAATCADLIRQNNGLLFKGCGDQGDILVPAP
jgi:hypothetical protein